MLQIKHKGKAHRLSFSKIKEMMLVYFFNLNHPFYFALTRKQPNTKQPTEAELSIA